jgi:hypothetical protein
MFEQILNWNLLIGSHPFPGPDGGTCVNEAAVVVAGLEYRSIRGVNDCPPCFSHPISEYAIRLNDCMPDDLRQELLRPFVVRLAGTADTLEVERERADTMAIRTVSDILPTVLRLYELESHALRCEAVKTLTQARAAARGARKVVSVTHAAQASHAVSRAIDAATNVDTIACARDAAYAASYAVFTAYNATAARYASGAAAYIAAIAGGDNTDAVYAIYVVARRFTWTRAVAILDAALRIGRQAEPVEIATIVTRAETAKRKAPEHV